MKPNRTERRLLDHLAGDTLLQRFEWDDWLKLRAPFRAVPFRTRPVAGRFSRNGYDWDVHGTLYEPDRECRPDLAFVMVHGGAGSEWELAVTPDGRPGLAAIVAAQGFRCLAVSFVGHYPPGGEWHVPVSRRRPVYLLDRDLSAAETKARNLACTFDVHVQGAAQLADKYLRGRDLLGFGHSTSGPMVVALHRHLKRARLTGILGWGSAEPNGWSREWSMLCNGRAETAYPIAGIARRTVAAFRDAGYADAPDLSPWGGVEAYMAWGDRFKSQMKTGLCDNQHRGNVAALRRTSERSGLPLEEYLRPLRDPEPDWLARTRVLLLTGENDVTLWRDSTNARDNRQIFMGEKYAMRAASCHVVLVPRFGHFGFVALHNETIAHAWLHAVAHGHFDTDE